MPTHLQSANRPMLCLCLGSIFFVSRIGLHGTRLPLTCLLAGDDEITPPLTFGPELRNVEGKRRVSLDEKNQIVSSGVAMSLRLLGTGFLTRAPLRCMAERAPLGDRFCPPPCLTREPRHDWPWRGGRDSNQMLSMSTFKAFKQIIKCHTSGRCHVKGQNRHLSPCRLLRRD